MKGLVGEGVGEGDDGSGSYRAFTAEDAAKTMSVENSSINLAVFGECTENPPLVPQPFLIRDESPTALSLAVRPQTATWAFL